MSIAVVGSANLDLVVHASHHPAPGETVIGQNVRTNPGGKGANQAVAAARLGADVHFIGRLGCDGFGDQLLNNLQTDGLDLTYLVRDTTTPTGLAMIVVDAHGENAIVVSPGANHQLTPHDIDDARPALQAAALCLVQFEIPWPTIRHLLNVCKELGKPVLINPAPACHPIPDAVYPMIDMLIPNESETNALLGIEIKQEDDALEAARAFRARGVKTAVITLGSKGVVAVGDDCEYRIPAPAVAAVDTTAAGDCFAGALAAALADQASLSDALTFAVRAASLAVTRHGAQPSLPTRSEIETLSP